jgi:flagellar M-ring protein FliF
MADLASQLNQLKTFKLDGRNRLIAGLVAACAVVSIIVVALMSKGPEYGPLYTNLAETDAAEITAKLKEDGVSYQIADEGRTIEVPKDQVYDVRMTLASEGLPQGQGVGYEIFDKSSFGQTDFTQRLNYIRALQGELTRTIMNLSPIESARVHLVVPEAVGVVCCSSRYSSSSGTTR